MARKKAFDPDLALLKAMEVFWRLGYEATSMEDLTRAMGIRRGSLYDTYGNKLALFMAALKRYKAVNVDPGLKHLKTAPVAKQALIDFFEMLFQHSLSDDGFVGCFVMNSVVSLPTLEPEARDYLEDATEELILALAAAFTKAKEQGDLPESADPVAKAFFLLNAIAGMRVLCKSRHRDAVLPNVRSEVFAALGWA